MTVTRRIFLFGTLLAPFVGLFRRYAGARWGWPQASTPLRAVPRVSEIVRNWPGAHRDGLAPHYTGSVLLFKGPSGPLIDYAAIQRRFRESAEWTRQMLHRQGYTDHGRRDGMGFPLVDYEAEARNLTAILDAPFPED